MYTRAQVANMFIQQAPRWRVYEVQPTNRPYQYTGYLNGKPFRFCVLAASSEYWTKRLHLTKNNSIGMVVCWQHDSCLTVDVLCLKDGKHYDPYALPAGANVHKRTKNTSSVLLGMLLSGMKDAYDLLPTLPLSTRRRYEKKLGDLSKRNRGRPILVE